MPEDGFGQQNDQEFEDFPYVGLEWLGNDVGLFVRLLFVEFFELGRFQVELKLFGLMLEAKKRMVLGLEKFETFEPFFIELFLPEHRAFGRLG